jgi:2-oxoglutarate ferredoxin oxidoreductase subunit beta
MMPQHFSDDVNPKGRHPLADMLNLNRFVFCAGCLIGTVITSIAACLKDENLSVRDYAIVSGIGCTGRSSGCFKAPAFHTTHGRAIPFATGLKLAKPSLKVFVLSGDGDISAIGGNHLIHAARRNVDISVICVNNSVYGMTGGQAAPTTQLGDITSSTPYGNVESPFNLVGLAAASGATYVARWPGYDTLRLQKSLRKALKRKGFSFIDVIVPCFTQYGRRNRKEGAIEMMEWLRDIVDLRVGCQPQEAVMDLNGGLVVCGEFVETDGEGFIENLQKLRDRVMEKAAGKQ